MTPRISSIVAVVGVALMLAAPAFGDSWAADRLRTAVRVSPDLADRVDAARQQELTRMLDARERSFATKSVSTSTVTPDPVRDDRFRLDAPRIPTPTPAIGSARDVEWLQIGIGFGGGVLLVAGLALALRTTRARQPAH
jgi:hypothetical protein